MLFTASFNVFGTKIVCPRPVIKNNCAGESLQQFTGQYWKLRRNKLNAYTERPPLLFVEKTDPLLNDVHIQKGRKILVIDLDET
jgi:hypothetical protein